MRIAGIMTGTSLDGIDVIISDFSGNANDGFTRKEVASKTFPFKDTTRRFLKKILYEDFYAFEISQMNFILSHIFDKAIKDLCKLNEIDFSSIDAIGVHGQTIWHQPVKKRFAGEYISSTLQLFSGPALAALTGKKVVYDFRAADVALGGQGAPLIPIYDHYFLRDEDNDIITLNIGGISNITYIPAKNSNHKIMAFDTGPGNILIDIAAGKYFDKHFDENGEIASKGNIIYEMLEDLNKVDFIHQAPPKSTGREMFNPIFLDNIIYDDYDKYDIMRTLTEFTASSIAENIEKFTNPKAKMVVSGGGALNTFLISRLKDKLKEVNFLNPESMNINIDFKEAECFAFLAYLNINKIPGNIPEVTGASRELVLGASAG